MHAIAIAIALHMLSAVIWVGGMFFAHQALRPVAASLLTPPQRLPLWVGTLGRFFVWVWLAVVLLLASGYWMALDMFGRFAAFPLYVNIMQGIGLLMMLLYFHVYFAPYQGLRRHVDAKDWPAAAAQLARIRRMVGINLMLGLTVVCVAATGRFLT
jgi:uncharacterized membrane protein